MTAFNAIEVTDTKPATVPLASLQAGECFRTLVSKGVVYMRVKRYEHIGRGQGFKLTDTVGGLAINLRSGCLAFYREKDLARPVVKLPVGATVALDIGNGPTQILAPTSPVNTILGEHGIDEDESRQ